MTDTSIEAFERIAASVYAALPAPIRQASQDVLIRIADFAEPEILDSLYIEDKYGLLGLYQGVDVTRKSVFDVTDAPDMVFLYREPILAFWQSGGDTLEAIIRHVLIHEIGHHFGYSDEDMDAIERQAEE